MLPTKIAPEQASNFAPQVDALFYIISFLTIFFFVAVMGVVVFCAIKYRQGSKADRSNPQNENLRIEIAWSVPPLILGLIIFAWGSVLFVDMRRPPKNAIEIFVIGKQWMWHIQHPNGVREMNELHVPMNVPIKLTMISQDVIHAFYIPQFRTQFMVVPGRYTYEWFTPTKPGKYYLFCAMHCGSGHSEMGGYVYVMPPQEYQKWLDHGGSSPLPQQTIVQQGQEMYTQLSCSNCHKEQDTDRAPSLYGIYNKTANTNRGPMLVTDDYIRNAIVSPYDKTVTGYSNTMPEYQRVSQTLPNGLTEEQLRGLVEYVKSLSNAATPTGTTPAATAAATPGQAGSSRSVAATIAAKGAAR